MEWNGNAVRQKPGPWNALGKVKFLFPNSHNIYLHDTPSKNAFGNDRGLLVMDVSVYLTHAALPFIYCAINQIGQKVKLMLP